MVGLLPGTGGARVQYEEIYQEADLECIEAVLEDHPEVRVPWGRPEVVEVGGVSPVLHVTVEAVVEGQIWRGRSPCCGATGRSSWGLWAGRRRPSRSSHPYSLTILACPLRGTGTLFSCTSRGGLPRPRRCWFRRLAPVGVRMRRRWRRRGISWPTYEGAVAGGDVPQPRVVHNTPRLCRGSGSGRIGAEGSKVGVSFATIAEQLRIPRPELGRKALKTFLEAELRSVDERIMALVARYGVKQARGLEELISQRSVGEHPAWEDLIEWEGLEGRRERLLELHRAAGGQAAVAEDGASCGQRGGRSGNEPDAREC